MRKRTSSSTAESSGASNADINKIVYDQSFSNTDFQCSRIEDVIPVKFVDTCKFEKVFKDFHQKKPKRGRRYEALPGEGSKKVFEADFGSKLFDSMEPFLERKKVKIKTV